jgi:competence protein ComEA
MSKCTHVCVTLGICLSLTQAQERLPSGPGRDTIKKVCSSCHDPENVVGLAKTREEWGQLVGDMAAKGAKGTDDEFNDVVDYLAEHFPQAPPVNVNKATAKDLENNLGFSSKEAEAIVRYRGEKGSFKSVADVEKVPGVDAKKVKARADRLAF